MRRRAWLAAVWLATACESSSARPLVGSNYFSGWWPGAGDKWIDRPVHNSSWLKQFPGRRPLLGEYNNQTTMDREITAAAANGVDFFQMLWYNVYNRSDLDAGSQFLNVGVETFQKSPVADRMSFYISFCNNAWSPELVDRAQWTAFVHGYWLPAMRHPSYLRVGGRLVFKIINAPSFYAFACNSSSACVAGMMDELRAAARGAGLGELIIGAGIDGCTWKPTAALTGYSYDWVGQYGTVPGLSNRRCPKPVLKPAPFIYPASVLAEFNTMERSEHIDWATAQANRSGSLGTFLPLLMTGWDAMPWGGEARPRFLPYSADEWVAQLRSVQSQMAAAGAAAGFPLPGGGVQAAFSMYCWNEFGEGGMLAPVEGLGSSRLEAIQRVFKATI